MKPEINQQLPLTPAVFQILLALSDGPKHGYLIMKEVESSTDNLIPMGPGTLYGSIKRMLEVGLIIETTSPPTETDQRRRYYKIKPFWTDGIGSGIKPFTKTNPNCPKEKYFGVI